MDYSRLFCDQLAKFNVKSIKFLLDSLTCVNDCCFLLEDHDIFLGTELLTEINQALEVQNHFNLRLVNV